MTRKKRHIPVISFNELELKQKKRQVYTSLIEGVSEAIKTKKSEIRLCEVKHTNSYITVHKDMWSDSLAKAMDFYIQKEEYEKCSKIKKLIEKL
tara:strand:- start:225 stop:506 length:282 start_codon:yes stop_codon:yes gene_type:complete